MAEYKKGFAKLYLVAPELEFYAPLHEQMANFDPAWTKYVVQKHVETIVLSSFLAVTLYAQPNADVVCIGDVNISLVYHYLCELGLEKDDTLKQLNANHLVVTIGLNGEFTKRSLRVYTRADGLRGVAPTLLVVTDQDNEMHANLVPFKGVVNALFMGDKKEEQLVDLLSTFNFSEPNLNNCD